MENGKEKEINMERKYIYFKKKQEKERKLS